MIANKEEKIETYEDLINLFQPECHQRIEYKKPPVTNTEVKKHALPTNVEAKMKDRKTLFNERMNILNEFYENEIKGQIIRRMQGVRTLEREFEDVVHYKNLKQCKTKQIATLGPSQFQIPGGASACTGIALSYCASYLLDNYTPVSYKEIKTMEILERGIRWYKAITYPQSTEFTSVANYLKNNSLFLQDTQNQIEVVEEIGGCLYQEMNYVTTMFINSPDRNLNSLWHLIAKISENKKQKLAIVITAIGISITLLANKEKDCFFIIDTHNINGTTLYHLQTNKIQALVAQLQSILIHVDTPLEEGYYAFILSNKG